MTQAPETTREAGGVGSLRDRVKDRVRRVAQGTLRPVVVSLARAGLRPDVVSFLGLVLSLAAALSFFEGGFRLGSVLLAAGGLCDLLDGELARQAGTGTRFGAFLDSTLDRLAEGLVLGGIAGFYIANLVDLAHSPGRVLDEMSRGLEPRTWAAVALTALVALVGSFLVSYTRARAEGLGIDCRIGWFERPERVLLLIVAGLFGVGPVMPGALLVLAALSFATAGQRIRHVYRVTHAAADRPR